MSSENIKNANKFIAELQSKMSEYKEFSKNKIRPLFRKDQKGRKPPGEFVDSSFLYIRSYDGDTGIRPFSNITFWLSPDITVAPINDLGAYTTALDAGKTYQFSCNIRNRGDLIIPSAKVEFYLCDPTLGFDTRYATKIGVTAGWVNPYNTTKVSINYTIPPGFGGHKCLFARAFSFSPLDLPIDDYQLNPTLDRHVAQLNLNIAAQSGSFMFQLIHSPNAMDKIELIPMNTEEIFALRHPFLADFRISKINTAQLIRKAKITVIENKDSESKTRIFRRGGSMYLHSINEKAIPLEKQKMIRKNLTKALKVKDRRAISRLTFREAFQPFREMNKQPERKQLELHIPNMGLSPKEATAIKIVATDRASGKIKGGITLIITG